MGKVNGKLSQQELTAILGDKRAQEIIVQDRRCAKLYDDMEQRTSELERVGRVLRNGAGEFDHLDDT